MLELDFSEEQEMLRTSARDLLADHCPLSVVREFEDDPVGYPRELWAQFAKLDLIGLMLPEEHGGAGMSILEGAVLYEELGRALVPTPHFQTAVICGGLIAAAGSDEQRSSWLPRIVTGEAVLTPAWLEPDRGFGATGVSAEARADGDGFLLTGTKRHVAYASSADRLVVLARSGAAAESVDLFLVDPSAPGVTMTQQMSVASDNQYRVDFDSVRVSAADRIGAAGTGWTTWDAVMEQAIVLLASFAIGGCTYALEITVQYAKDRHQFDKPLGAFQSLAHYLADAQTALDGATQLVHEAAWAIATRRPEATKLAPMAKLFACETFRDVTATAQQIFGGVGFTVEFDIQLYFRRAKALQVSWWNDRFLEERIATAVLGR